MGGEGEGQHWMKFWIYMGVNVMQIIMYAMSNMHVYFIFTSMWMNFLFMDTKGVNPVDFTPSFDKICFTFTPM